MSAESTLKAVLPVQAARTARLTDTPATPGIPAAEFDGIVREHQRRIYRLFVALLCDADAAQTLAQDCFLQAYRKRKSYRGEASVGTWLARIAINLARDYRKNRRRAFWSRVLRIGHHERAANAAGDYLDAAAAELARIKDCQPSAERVLAAREELATVWAAVDGLATQQREVFLLRFAEEMSLGEIAEAMELEIGTVKSHLHRAVATVRARLKENQ